MNVEEAMEESKGSPDLLEHVAYLNRVAADEKRRRKQFYQDLNEDTKAEFINGRVIVHSPVRQAHLQAGFFITNLLGNFALWRELGVVYSEKCLIRCKRNDYEPDICFFSRAKCDGWSRDKLVFPPPDLVVEILSPSSVANDRALKLHDYARHQVGEYWIVDADKRAVEQYTLPSKTKEYSLKMRLLGHDPLVSTALAGFMAPVAAFFDARENERALRALLGQS